MFEKVNADLVARYIVQKCIADDRPISNPQLQKILYFCQEECLREQGRPLFDDEIEAWMDGPVIPDVHRTFSLWGGRRITRAEEFDASALKGWKKEIVDRVTEVKRENKPWDLVDETNAAGTPWDAVYRGGYGEGMPIAVDEILGYAARTPGIA